MYIDATDIDVRPSPQDRFIAEESSVELLASGRGTCDAVMAALNDQGSTLDERAALAAIDLGATGTLDQWSSRHRTWVLDPIDGTKGYLRGDQYAIALALLDGGQPVFGVLGCPNYGDCGTLYWAERGGGAFCSTLESVAAQSTRLQVSVPSEGRSGIVRCEAYETGHSNHGQAATAAAALGIVADPIRMDGQGKYGVLAAGLAHAYTRLPRAGYVENIWDHAAGSILVEEAGGRVSDTRGRPLDFSLGAKLSDGVTGIIASNGECHEDLLRALRSTPSQP